jgi:hypothetical protein
METLFFRHVYDKYLLRTLVGMAPGLLLAGSGCSYEGESPPGTARAPVTAAGVSAEIFVDQAVPSPVPGRRPAAAFGGGQYLVVWEDHRTRQDMLYGGRVAADGTALDPIGFPILDLVPGSNPFGEYRPVVASDGADFLVVTEAGGQIHGVRVSAAGALLDPGGFAISAADGPVSWPSVVFDGEQYLVAWAEGAQPAGPDNGVYYARVTPEGTVLDPGGVRAYTAGAAPYWVGVSFDGASYLLSWEDIDDTLRAGRVAPDGTLVDTTPFRANPVGTTVGHGPVGGFDGTNHVIAWMGLSPDEWYRVQAVRVTPAGAILDPDGIDVDRNSVDGWGVNRLDMVSGNGSTTVVWSIEDIGGKGGGQWPSAIQIARIAADGAVSSHPAHALQPGREATLVAQPAGGLLLWRDGGGDDASADYSPIAGARLDAAGALVPGSVVAPASPASRQDVTDVASDGQSYFVLWRDTRDVEGKGRALYGARVSADGVPLDTEALQLASVAADLSDVVFDGANYVVTFVHDTGGEGDGNPFRTVRVSPAGERLDAEVLHPPLSSSGETLASASDGTHTLLVGDDPEDVDIALAAVLLDQGGAVASDVVPIARRDELPLEPRASFDGTGYLVVWRGNDEIFGQRIDTQGALVGERFVIASAGFIYQLTVGAGAGNHLVVWQDEEGIFVARVSPAGQVLDPGGRLVVALEPMCRSGGCCTGFADLTTGNCASVAFDGDNFVLAWRAPAVAGDASSLDLYAAELNPAGETLRQLAISEAPDLEGAPFLAAGGHGQVLAAYTHFVPGAPYDTRRAQARLLASDDPGPIPPDAGPPGPTPDAGGSPADPPPGGGHGCHIGAERPAPVAPLVLLGGLVALSLVRRRRAR